MLKVEVAVGGSWRRLLRKRVSRLQRKAGKTAGNGGAATPPAEEEEAEQEQEQEKEQEEQEKQEEPEEHQCHQQPLHVEEQNDACHDVERLLHQLGLSKYVDRLADIDYGALSSEVALQARGLPKGPVPPTQQHCIALCATHALRVVGHCCELPGALHVHDIVCRRDTDANASATEG